MLRFPSRPLWNAADPSCRRDLGHTGAASPSLSWQCSRSPQASRRPEPPPLRPATDHRDGERTGPILRPGSSRSSTASGRSAGCAGSRSRGGLSRRPNGSRCTWQPTGPSRTQTGHRPSHDRPTSALWTVAIGAGRGARTSPSATHRPGPSSPAGSRRPSIGQTLRTLSSPRPVSGLQQRAAAGSTGLRTSETTSLPAPPGSRFSPVFLVDPYPRTLDQIFSSETRGAPRGARAGHLARRASRRSRARRASPTRADGRRRPDRAPGRSNRAGAEARGRAQRRGQLPPERRLRRLLRPRDRGAGHRPGLRPTGRGARARDGTRRRARHSSW